MKVGSRAGTVTAPAMLNTSAPHNTTMSCPGVEARGIGRSYSRDEARCRRGNTRGAGVVYP